MPGAILVSIVLFLVLAIFFAKLAYRRTDSIVLRSAAFTLFCSFGLAVDRIAVPVPTLIFLPMLLYDLINAPPCVPTSEGCYSETDPGADLLLFFFLFLIQWAFWALIFVTFRKAFFPKRR